MLVPSLTSLKPETGAVLGLITRETAIERAIAEFGTAAHDWGREQREREQQERAPKPKSRERANAAATVEKLSRSSRQRIEQLENVKAWAEFYAGRALMHHDLAARAAEQRDQAIALVERLEIGEKI